MIIRPNSPANNAPKPRREKRAKARIPNPTKMREARSTEPTFIGYISIPLQRKAKESFGPQKPYRSLKPVRSLREPL